VQPRKPSRGAHTAAHAISRVASQSNETFREIGGDPPAATQSGRSHPPKANARSGHIARDHRPFADEWRSCANLRAPSTWRATDLHYGFLSLSSFDVQA